MNTTKTVIVRRNQAKTAWLVISGTVPELSGALVIENFCHTKASAIAWCASRGFVVADAL